jgi:aryl-alcohol dehydrogenase-like predicted oxidoreductase
LRAQPTISAPIASARTVDQLREMMPLITLTKEELASL